MSHYSDLDAIIANYYCAIEEIGETSSGINRLVNQNLPTDTDQLRHQISLQVESDLAPLLRPLLGRKTVIPIASLVHVEEPITLSSSSQHPDNNFGEKEEMDRLRAEITRLNSEKTALNNDLTTQKSVNKTIASKLNIAQENIQRYRTDVEAYEEIARRYEHMCREVKIFAVRVEEDHGKLHIGKNNVEDEKIQVFVNSVVLNSGKLALLAGDASDDNSN